MLGGQQGQGWTRGDLDAGLGQQDDCLQAGGRGGGVVVALSPQLLPAQISRQESRARWHGQADKAALRGEEQWAQVEPPRPFCLATSAPTSPAKPGRGPAATLLTQKRVARSC